MHIPEWTMFLSVVTITVWHSCTAMATLDCIAVIGAMCEFAFSPQSTWHSKVFRSRFWDYSFVLWNHRFSWVVNYILLVNILLFQCQVPENIARVMYWCIVQCPGSASEHVKKKLETESFYVVLAVLELVCRAIRPQTHRDCPASDSQELG